MRQCPHSFADSGFTSVSSVHSVVNTPCFHDFSFSTFHFQLFASLRLCVKSFPDLNFYLFTFVFYLVAIAFLLLVFLSTGIVKSRSNRAVKGGFETQVFDGKNLQRHFYHEAIEGNEA